MTCSVILVGAIATCVMSASAQDPASFDHIVVFGDSLSDTGNAGRFSNGSEPWQRGRGPIPRLSASWIS